VCVSLTWCMCAHKCAHCVGQHCGACTLGVAGSFLLSFGRILVHNLVFTYIKTHVLLVTRLVSHKSYFAQITSKHMYCLKPD